MTPEQKRRAWLSQKRAEGHPFGIMVPHRRGAPSLGSQPLGKLGPAAFCLYEEGWVLVLFAHEEDREAFKGRLPKGSWRPDPLEGKEIKDA